MNEIEIKDLVGMVFDSYEIAIKDNESLTINVCDLYGDIFIKLLGKTNVAFYHDSECCEQVWLEDVCGDMQDLLGTPILKAYVTIMRKDEPMEEEDSELDEVDDWIFYHLSTIKGSVTLRFNTSSNGFYSTDVSVATF